MGNDSIYPPAVTASLFEYAWKSWRDGELNDQGFTDELRIVADWVNTITKGNHEVIFGESTSNKKSKQHSLSSLGKRLAGTLCQCTRFF